MKKLFSVLTIAMLFSVMASYSFGQAKLRVSNTYAAGGTLYDTWQAAFNDVMANTSGGGANPIITVEGNMTEGATAPIAGAVLNNNSPTAITTLKILTNGTWTVITPATITGPIMTFNNIDNSVINGSIADGTGPAKDLTLTHLNTTSTLMGILSLSNGSSGNTVKWVNCTSPSLNGRMINVALTTSAVVGGNNNNTVANCEIDGGARGLQDFGTAGIASNDNTTFKYNKVRNSSALAIFLGSVANGVTCEGNEVYFTNPALVLGASFVGIQIQCAGTVNILKNRIYDFHVQGGAATAYRGMISLPASFTAPLVDPVTVVNIINNFVTLSPVNPTGTLVLGIQTQFSAAVTSISYTANVMNNTSYIGGTSSAATGALTEAILGNRVTPAGTQTYVHNLSNNIAINKREGGSPTAAFHVGLDIEPPPTPGLTVNSDYNMSWASNVSNPTRSWAVSYDFLYTNTDLAVYLFQTANVPTPSIEQHSIFKDAPLLAGTKIGALDPLLIGGDMCGLPKSAVTDDIINTSRNPLYPYKGCWEGPALKVLSLTLCLEGKVSGGPITVSLYDAGCNYIADCSGYIDFNTGKTNLCFGNKVVDATGYSLKVNSINHLATWSALPNISFAAGGPPNATYDFTTNVNKAYGSNQADDPVCLYGGDVNQDGTIDVTDLGEIDNDGFNFVGGKRIPTDVNSDLTVDVTDAAIADNNAYNFVSTQAPCGPEPSSIISNQTKEVRKLQNTDKSNAIFIEAQQ